MSTIFCLEGDEFRTPFYRRHYTLLIALANFEILREILDLPSPYGDATGSLAAKELLQKIERAEAELNLHGKEWERSYTPPPERQQGQKLQVMGTPELSQENLRYYLSALKLIAREAQEHDANVKWD